MKSISKMTYRDLWNYYNGFANASGDVASPALCSTFSEEAFINAYMGWEDKCLADFEADERASQDPDDVDSWIWEQISEQVENQVKYDREHAHDRAKKV